uniref:Ciliary neurotrophic factor n=1 Tax=Oryzias latipes TaxID=8090 RepID=A0A3P9MGY1_ORYLA
MIGLQFACEIEGRMNGHAKNMHFKKFMKSIATLLSFLLLMAVHSTRMVGASRNQPCRTTLQRTFKLAKVVQSEASELFKIYKASQGEGSEFLCKAPVNNIPDPNISGLEASERISSIYTHLQSFIPHLKRVYEQQTDLQLPTSPLLPKLLGVSANSRNLALSINDFYHRAFPNLPLPEPAGGPTTLPPPLNVFQQKVYGCMVLKTYKEFTSNVSKEFKSFRGKVCRRRMKTNALF